jgi:hypothetical protein
MSTQLTSPHPLILTSSIPHILHIPPSSNPHILNPHGSCAAMQAPRMVAGAGGAPEGTSSRSRAQPGAHTPRGWAGAPKNKRPNPKPS